MKTSRKTSDAPSSMPHQHLPTYVFGDFILDAGGGTLLHQGEAVLLPNKAIKLLLLLVQKHGQVVSKAEIFQALWQDVAVEESNLLQTVYILRKALGENAERKFIEAVTRVGYRFVVDVQEVWDTFSSFWLSNEAKSRITGRPSISDPVLPFNTASLSAGSKHLGLSLADVLTTKLTGVEQLVVRPTYSILKYVDSTADIMTIGRELSVDAVFSGSIQVTDDRVRVTVQLVSAVDNQQLWAETFDEKLIDIFSTQDAVSERVVRALRLRLKGGEQGAASKLGAVDAEAFEAYARGVYFFNKRDVLSLIRSSEYFRRAVEVCPDFGLAYSGLAGSLARLGVQESAPASHVYERYMDAKMAAIKAMEFGALAPAHAVMGHIYYLYERDMERAEAEFRRALDLDRGDATARLWYYVLLLVEGRLDEAFEQLCAAYKLDPVSFLVSGNLGYIYYLRGDYKIALEFIDKSLEMEDWSPRMGTYRAWILEQEGRLKEAAEQCERNRLVRTDDLFHALNLGSLGRIHAKSGDMTAARGLIAELEGRPVETPGADYALGMIYAETGDVERAVNSFRDELGRWQGTQRPLFEDIIMSLIRHDPALASVRRADEYPRLLDDYIALFKSRTVPLK